MEFADLLRRRRMIRNYTDEPVEHTVLERIMRRARSAPSAGFSQGVRFVVVTEPATRARIAELADEPFYVEHGYEPWISRAPAHVVVALREQDYHDRYTEPEKLEDGEEMEWPAPWWWVDAGKATMLLLLAIADEGLGAGLFTLYPRASNDLLREELGMPDDLQVVGCVALGHPAPEPKEVARAADLKRRRRPFEEVVRWERWA
ncbi:MAG: nitroreductase family protein [Gaiella sp.]